MKKLNQAIGVTQNTKQNNWFALWMKAASSLTRLVWLRYSISLFSISTSFGSLSYGDFRNVNLSKFSARMCMCHFGVKIYVFHALSLITSGNCRHAERERERTLKIIFFYFGWVVGTLPNGRILEKNQFSTQLHASNQCKQA